MMARVLGKMERRGLGFKGACLRAVASFGEWGAWARWRRPCASWALRRFRPEVGEGRADGWGPHGSGWREGRGLGWYVLRERQKNAGPARLARLKLFSFFFVLFLFCFFFKTLIQKFSKKYFKICFGKLV